MITYADLGEHRKQLAIMDDTSRPVPVRTEAAKKLAAARRHLLYYIPTQHHATADALITEHHTHEDRFQQLARAAEQAGNSGDAHDAAGVQRRITEAVIHQLIELENWEDGRRTRPKEPRQP